MKKQVTQTENINAFDKLLWKAIRYHIPYIVTFELTYSCNQKCVHCYLTHDDPYQKEMPVEEWLRAIGELKELGTFYVSVTGGEPTLYPGFWEIIEELHRQNMLIRVFTNATTFTKDDIDHLIRCGVQYVDISIHGSDRDTHEEITGVPGSYDRTVNAIKQLKAAGIHVMLKGSLLKSNYKKVNNLNRLMLSLGGYPHISHNITPDNNGGQQPLEYAISEVEFCYVFDNFYKTDYDLPDVEEDHIPLAIRCTAGFSTMTITPNGTVIPCVQFRAPLGNIQRNSLRRIWHHSPLCQYLSGLTRLSPSECTGCKFITFCIRCPGLSFIETGSLWKPSPNACRAAEHYFNAYYRSRGKRSASA